MSKRLFQACLCGPRFPWCPYPSPCDAPCKDLRATASSCRNLVGSSVIPEFVRDSLYSRRGVPDGSDTPWRHRPIQPLRRLDTALEFAPLFQASPDQRRAGSTLRTHFRILAWSGGGSPSLTRRSTKHGSSKLSPLGSYEAGHEHHDYYSVKRNPDSRGRTHRPSDGRRSGKTRGRSCLRKEYRLSVVRGKRLAFP